MRTSDRIDSDDVVVRAASAGTRAAPQHVVELIAAMSAQTDDHWRLELVARGYVGFRSWHRIVARQPQWIRERVVVRARTSRSGPSEADLQLRIDDVPLEHLVETVRAHGRDLRFPAVVQPVTRTRWPRRSSGWTITGPPTPGTFFRVGGGRDLVEDFLVLRRDWTRRPTAT